MGWRSDTGLFVLYEQPFIRLMIMQCSHAVAGINIYSLLFNIKTDLILLKIQVVKQKQKNMYICFTRLWS